MIYAYKIILSAHFSGSQFFSLFVAQTVFLILQDTMEHEHSTMNTNIIENLCFVEFTRSDIVHTRYYICNLYHFNSTNGAVWLVINKRSRREIPSENEKHITSKNSNKKFVIYLFTHGNITNYLNRREENTYSFLGIYCIGN